MSIQKETFYYFIVLVLQVLKIYYNDLSVNDKLLFNLQKFNKKIQKETLFR